MNTTHAHASEQRRTRRPCGPWSGFCWGKGKEKVRDDNSPRHSCFLFVNSISHRTDGSSLALIDEVGRTSVHTHSFVFKPAPPTNQPTTLTKYTGGAATALPSLSMTVVRALRRPTEDGDDSSSGTIDLPTLDAAVALLVRLRDRVLSSLEAEEEGEGEENKHVGRLLVEEDARGR